MLIFLGGLAFGVGWLVGVILLWSSPIWRLRDQLMGTLVVPGGLGLPFWLYIAGSATVPLSWVMLVLVVLSVVTAVLLARRIRRRRTPVTAE